ncbi:MAG: sulfite exporter TauE/SafE family protein [Armatimonadota bacterium]|nr:sulfite exporter TauE/SafE family protein [Armatimonadota bacterium]MDR7451833.1 sulfite exporter TauE/SafE family protein [Armatimonadota bacterium]MDR7467558.1 sulfite exporter TauE/SafE family protein [Armatimonadota bacterium]MDR7494481.1 sulfite exporter TauE/SafE family protein [Armatimonadota bacterium]MDR7499742.1 sulfite exporter TauE/SafE family protein [Armatimonadota bacterium]
MDDALALNAPFAFVLLVIVLATAVKAALGFGFPLIAVPLATLLVGPRNAVLLIAIPVVVTNFTILLRGGGTSGDFRRFGGMLLAVVVGTLASAPFLGRLDPELLTAVVGATAVVFAGLSFWDLVPSVPRELQPYAGTAVGLFAGLVGGVTGIFAPPIAAYIHTLRVDKRVFVFWLTASFMLGGLTQAVSYYRLGLYTPTVALYALLACLPALLGTRIGLWIQDWLPAELFRRLVLLLVLVTGVSLIGQSLR